MIGCSLQVSRCLNLSWLVTLLSVSRCTGRTFIKTQHLQVPSSSRTNSSVPQSKCFVKEPLSLRICPYSASFKQFRGSVLVVCLSTVLNVALGLLSVLWSHGGGCQIEWRSVNLSLELTILLVNLLWTSYMGLKSSKGKTEFEFWSYETNSSAQVKRIVSGCVLQ